MPAAPPRLIERSVHAVAALEWLKGLAALALAFGVVATGLGSRDLAIFATGGAALFCLWGLGMIGLFRLRIAHFPQWALFAAIAISGVIGLQQ